MGIPERMMSNLPEISGDLDLRLSTLMRAAQANQREAYAELLEACLPLITNVGQRAGATGDKIDDIVRETLVVVHRARQTYDPSRSFVAWLTAIARHLSIDTMRRERRRSTR